jgi:Spy/CpxP family protein refolding chaperone
MDYFSKNKILMWIIAILVLLNVLTLSTLWITYVRNPFRSFREETTHRRQGLKILERELNLSPEQIKVFDDIRRHHFEKMESLQKEIFSIRRELMDELDKTVPDSERIRLLTIRIGEKETLRERYIFEHFMQMKSACTPQQQEKFRHLLRGLMAPPQDRPMPGPRRQEFGFGPDEGTPPFFDGSYFIFQ